MSDSTIQFLTKQPGPVRINANNSGMWAGRGDAWLLNPIFIFLSVNHPTQYWMEATHEARQTHGGIGEDWILLNWSLTIRHLKADNSPILYLEAVEAVKKLCVPVCTQHCVCIICSEQPACQAAVECAACAGPGPPSTHNTRSGDQL